MRYPKYTWVGNRIDDEDMRKLFQLKQITGKPITQLVAEAVSQFVENETRN